MSQDTADDTLRVLTRLHRHVTERRRAASARLDICTACGCLCRADEICPICRLKRRQAKAGA